MVPSRLSQWIEHAVARVFGGCDAQVGERLPRLQLAQEGEHAVQHADVPVGGDHDALVIADRCADDHVALVADLLQRLVQVEVGDHGELAGVPATSIPA